MKKRYSFFLLVLISLLSCKKDDDKTLNTPNLLFSINFTNNWLCENCEDGMIIIQSTKGEVLYEKTIAGNTSVSFGIPENFISELFRITIISPQNDGSIRINTYDDVSVGMQWQFVGNYRGSRIPRQQINLSFDNIPEHEGFILSSYISSYYSWGGLLENSQIYYQYNDPLDLYVLLKNADGIAKYGFYEDITEETILDLNDLITVNSTKNIDFPADKEDTRFVLRGYRETTNFNSGSFSIESLRNCNGTEQIYLPEQYPLTSCSYSYIEPNRTSDRYYIYHYGNIPDSFDAINGGISVNILDQNSFSFTYTGNYNYMRAVYNIPISGSYWLYYAPLDKSNYSIPKLPESVMKYFPDNYNDSINITSVSLVNHNSFNDYQDFIHSFTTNSFIHNGAVLNVIKNYPDSKSTNSDIEEHKLYLENLNY